jgi:hypothetical protein
VQGIHCSLCAPKSVTGEEIIAAATAKLSTAMARGRSRIRSATGKAGR